MTGIFGLSTFLGGAVGSVVARLLVALFSYTGWFISLSIFSSLGAALFLIAFFTSGEYEQSILYKFLVKGGTREIKNKVDVDSPVLLKRQ